MSEHNQEALLIKYLDNQASPAEREQVQALIDSDDVAAGLFAELKKTQQPLQQNFDSSLPDANPAMAELINDWQPNRTTKQESARTFRVGVGAIAATLFIGIIAGHLLTSMYTARSTSGSVINSTVQVQSTPQWIRLVADYHRLYNRQTIENAPVQDINIVSASVSQWLDRETSIPDLNASDISFRRAQQLTVDDDTLVQLAYLPMQDKPVAICIRKTKDSSNTDVNVNEYQGMQYAEWQDGYHAVVIVGHLPKAQLATIAESVKSTLFGNA